MPSERTAALAVLWGKSDAGGQPNLLLQHLLDTAAVAELIWDHYLAGRLKSWLDDVCGNNGRSFFALLCGWHDVGKASPAFQGKVDELAQAVQAAGLTWRGLNRESAGWHHTCAGAVIVRSVLSEAGWGEEAVEWVWPLVAGHHGLLPSRGSVFKTASRLRNAQGAGEAWKAAQAALAHAVADALDVDLARLAPVKTPRRGEQLGLCGFVIMADWIASSDHFTGVFSLAEVSMAAARNRAAKAWAKLELRGGWGAAPYRRMPDLVAARFGKSARPLQSACVELAEQMGVPALLVIEAPMGEGKTEGALVAAEVLGRRFGCDGIFVGMPTQATSDPMFDRVLQWADQVDRELPVGLLHGKRMFNRRWNALQQKTHFAGIDDLGCDDEFGMAGRGGSVRPEHAPAQWFLGAKRGMLMPVTVGTVDHLLYAATRTKHVMLRHAGVAGRVVILDEVHAYDVYMSQFLHEALRWLADAGVPVILLSATLPPQQRESLMRAYLQGVQSRRAVDLPAVGETSGYPVLHALTAAGVAVTCATRTTASWRPTTPVAVHLREEALDGGPETVVNLLDDELRAGGCALVIRNTVGRAQQTYQALAEKWGADEVILLHARLTVAERAARTGKALDLLGPPGGSVARPSRLIVVATQLAEQSFDVDADLLVTDLAPIDLLLQRVGRVHRHTRPGRTRPPKVFVTGLRTHPAGPPVFPAGSEHIYGRYLLLRAAALVADAAAGDGWSIPADVPDLVRRGYGDSDIVVASWQEATVAAHDSWQVEQRRRRQAAEVFLLAGESELGAPTLSGLHGRATGEARSDDEMASVVRDGPESVEVVLVRQGGGRYLTLGGRSLGPSGDVGDAALAEEVVGSTVRLPARPAVTEAAKKLEPLPGWYGNGWLSKSYALVLDERNSAILGGRRLTYDKHLGLLDERA
ncbi:CRISPR-associated helicase Cas3' [Micromonospora sp. 4G55]|uniref:CRISPR-associated helicase Cas3' n=1 Tax=Micromonospora sp. 4G55 TaxID=2806102 RepID=UPI001A445CE6|nr:CRISPR-associated helicase Cas3' [Micromonospora sp. 4G55]MBM0258166.1 CRISPR-associated helicase Cas3' [Micromonospora sp. 4G55]